MGRRLAWGPGRRGTSKGSRRGRWGPRGWGDDRFAWFIGREQSHMIGRSLDPYFFFYVMLCLCFRFSCYVSFYFCLTKGLTFVSFWLTFVLYIHIVWVVTLVLVSLLSIVFVEIPESRRIFSFRNVVLKIKWTKIMIKKERSVVNKMSAYIKKKENVHRRVFIKKNTCREILVCVDNKCI